MLVNRYCSSIATQSARYLQSPYYGFYDLNHHKMIMLLTVTGLEAGTKTEPMLVGKSSRCLIIRVILPIYK
jgi:hypothetical protein